MVFSVSPSVTVREVDATTTIPAIATPPAAIAGVFRWGPTNERILVTSENELVSRFGKPTNLNPETFFTAADFLSYSNALYVTRVTSADAAAATGTYFNAKYPGALGNSIEVSYVTSSSAYSQALANTALILNEGNDDIIPIGTSELTIITTEDFTSALANGDIIRVGNDDIGYQNLLVDTYEVLVGDDIFTYSINLKNRYSLSATSYSDLTYTRQWGLSYLFSGAPAPGSMHIVVTDRGGAITGVSDTILEVYENVSRSPTAQLSDGSNNYYANVITNRSAWVSVDESQTLNTASDTFGYERLVGGADGSNESSIPFGRVAEGYDLYRDSAEVDIAFILQGKATTANLPNYIVQNIAERRKDCVAFISPPFNLVVTPSNPQVKLTEILSYRTQVQSSSYWFMDSGYKYRYDKYNDVYRWVPLNGDMAGLAARIEPWESPAGFKRGIIKNVVKLAFNPNKEQRDQLYGNDINPVVSQVGQGILLFGDKTGLGTATGSAFTRINVRRLFITVEKAIATIAASFLFDFNDEFTQTQFRNTVEPLLRDIQGRRGIIDFRVISDGTVNTPDVIDRNIFRGNIFIKPARTINFIELTFIATRTGVEFDEIIGQAL
jgi:hypothetical protein